MLRPHSLPGKTLLSWLLSNNPERLPGLLSFKWEDSRQWYQSNSWGDLAPYRRQSMKSLVTSQTKRLLLSLYLKLYWPAFWLTLIALAVFGWP